MNISPPGDLFTIAVCEKIAPHHCWGVKNSPLRRRFFIWGQFFHVVNQKLLPGESPPGDFFGGRFFHATPALDSLGKTSEFLANISLSCHEAVRVLGWDLQIPSLSPVSRRPLLLQAMDISSVRRPPVSVMMPADRVSAHDLPLAEFVSAIGVEREKYHK